MKAEMRKKILAYNKTVAQRKVKAEELDILVQTMLKLPYGQLKKFLSEEVMEILKKYGYTEDDVSL